MTTHRARVRGLVTAVAFACAAAVAVAPAGASATTAPHYASARISTTAVHGHFRIRAYDHSLLNRVNSARAANARHSYTMIHKLHHVARLWARHLAATGVLEHNPALVADVSRVCPNWTALGENVGVEGGSNAGELFSAYMHSPPHRANILDSSYTVVGIATVTVTWHGQQTQWNVMDFANHCH